ncbi:uncharacterized protein LOC122515238 isoform X2 [Polistes fuscatus]|uniref:uncharacterized protein LOC122515238 isoform X2 n=1 Tax=Polistes fuscatus TaxID=30207 RepID=UPI001CA9BFD7|nr:uncharacterized protein LOC122515238 isoform X2 [Polistes fuscatus]
MEVIEGQYNLGNYIYTIRDSKDVHAKLKSEYIKLNGDHLEFEVQNQKIPTDTGFIWTKKATLLLMEEYYARKEKFRDFTIKKKLLWKEIAVVFEKNNYYVSPENLDKKFRNLKRTYIKIRDNIKKSPNEKDRITWEYYEHLKTIFEKDYNINNSSTINKTVVKTEGDEKILKSIVHNKNSLSGKSVEDNNSILMLSDQSDHYNDTEEIFCDVKPISIHKEVKLRTQRKRQAKTFREERLSLEQEKVKELRLLRKAIEHNNEIQKERNQLFSSLIMNISYESLNECKFGSSYEKT